MSEMPASSRLPAVMTEASTLSPMASYDGRVEIACVDLLQRHHVGHVGLHGGNLRRPTVHQFAILVDGEHILTHHVERVVATELPKRPKPTTRTLLVLLAMMLCTFLKFRLHV